MKTHSEFKDAFTYMAQKLTRKLGFGNALDFQLEIMYGPSLIGYILFTQKHTFINLFVSNDLM